MKKGIDVLTEMYEKFGWLYEVTTPNILPNDYILQLNRKTNSAFFKYICPDFFKPDILEKYRDNLLWTYPYTVDAGGCALISLLAIDDSTILEISLGAKKDDLVAGCAIHTNKPKNYFEFLKNNHKFIYSAEEKMGFL